MFHYLMMGPRIS